MRLVLNVGMFGLKMKYWTCAEGLTKEEIEAKIKKVVDRLEYTPSIYTLERTKREERERAARERKQKEKEQLEKEIEELDKQIEELNKQIKEWIEYYNGEMKKRSLKKD
jgi:DNA primase